jgi:predicted DNA-binding transcriptional regulator AlpA
VISSEKNPMAEKEEKRDYKLEEIADLLDMTAYSVRNALWRYRRQGLTERDYLAGLTSVPPAYKAGRSLRWPVEKYEQWKAARMTFDLQPVVRQREIRAQARERNKPGSGASRKPGRPSRMVREAAQGAPTGAPQKA